MLNKNKKEKKKRKKEEKRKMTIFAIQVRATLENISKLIPIQNNLWKFDVVNSSGERKEGITVSLEDEIQLEGSRGTANFVMKWPGN